MVCCQNVGHTCEGLRIAALRQRGCRTVSRAGHHAHTHIPSFMLAQVSLLGACGLQLRAANPAAMKDFVLAVHERVAEASSQGNRAFVACRRLRALLFALQQREAHSYISSLSCLALICVHPPSLLLSHTLCSGSGLSKRAQLMLDLVIDIKNNKAPGK